MRGGVFVCHASRDAGTAQRAVTALEAAGVPCWIAPRDIDAGENYTQAILDGLDAAPAIVLVFSSATNDSPHVARELETAVGSGRPIIPVRLEQVEPSRSLRYFIGTAQWLEANGPVGDWSPTLVRAVRRAIGRPEPPVPAAAAAPQPPPAQLAQPDPPEPRAHPARPEAVGAPSSKGGRRLALIGGGAVVVVLAVVLTVVLTRGGEPTTAVDRSALDGGTATPAPTDSTSPDGGSDPSATDSPDQHGSTTARAVTTTPSTPVTCWDGSQAPSVQRCPVPSGRRGMATVFPGLTAACTPVESPIEGKAEVYECQHDGFVVRYTRWDKGFEKERYYEVENQVPSQPWEIAGEQAGLQWFSIENDPAEDQPYQWSAEYAGSPFSVSVEGETSADRSAGLSELELVPPSRVGLSSGG